MTIQYIDNSLNGASRQIEIDYLRSYSSSFRALETGLAARNITTVEIREVQVPTMAERYRGLGRIRDSYIYRTTMPANYP